MTCILISRSIGGVFVDVVLSEEHTAEMEIADHPVEKGAKVSDHAWRNPYSVRLESVIDELRAMAAYEQLLAVQETAEPFDLVTGLKVYNNMLIKNVQPTRDKEHSRVLYFTAECREVIIVDTEASPAGSASDPSSTGSDAAKKTTARGEVQARVSTPPASTRSILQTAAGE